MDKMLFSLPLPETVSKMQIKCRLLEWQKISVGSPPPAYYNFSFCTFCLLKCNMKQKVCDALRKADRVGFGTLT